MRLIDADAIDWGVVEYAHGKRDETIVDCEILIKLQPTIDAVEVEWIPVTERMPEEDYCTGKGVQYSESVLVTVIHHSNDDDVFVDMACTADGEWQLSYPQDDTPLIPKWCEVIAWMPLPKPYDDGKREAVQMLERTLMDMTTADRKTEPQTERSSK